MRTQNNKEPPLSRRFCSQPLWDILSQRAGFGEAPQQAFLRACGPAKISGVATPELLAETRNPGSGAKKRRRVLLFTHPPFL